MDVFIYWPSSFYVLVRTPASVCLLLQRRARVLTFVFIFKCRLLTLKERKPLIIFSVYFCTKYIKGGGGGVSIGVLDFLI